MNSSDMNVDHHSLTFSQRYGHEPAPSPLALGQISKEARIRLWDLLYQHVERPRNVMSEYIFPVLHRKFLGRPADDFGIFFDQNKLGYSSNVASYISENYRQLFLDNSPFNKVFDVLEMVMRHPKCPKSFIKGVAEIFEECQMAYVVDINQPPTIMPAATKEEGAAIVGAMNELRDAGLGGAEAHLRNAGSCINQRDWAGSVRESINAVESVARLLDKNKSNKLATALESLDSKHSIHPALKEGFKKLYGYTSEEQGVRHALLDSKESAVGQDEAVFMLGACASFVSYLLHKYQASK